MDDDPVKAALDSLFEKYRGIELERLECHIRLGELDSEDAKLRPKIVALAAALDEPVDPDSGLGKFLAETASSGLTEGVRTVLRASDICKTPMDIRDGLLRLGYDLSGYNNVLASIHTILGRLIEKDEVKKVRPYKSKENAYLWKSDAKQEDLAKQLKKDLDYLRTEIKPDPLSKING